MDNTKKLLIFFGTIVGIIALYCVVYGILSVYYNTDMTWWNEIPKGEKVIIFLLLTAILTKS